MGFIDIVVNLFTAEEIALGQTGIDADFMTQVRMPEAMRKGVSIEQYMQKMDRAGIDRSLLIAVRAGDLKVKGSFEIPYERVGRFVPRTRNASPGSAGVDPFRGHARPARPRTRGARPRLCRRASLSALVRAARPITPSTIRTTPSAASSTSRS